MYWQLKRRIALLGGASAGVLCATVNILNGAEILFATFVAACVAMVVALILLATAHAIGSVLITFYEEQRRRTQLAEGEQIPQPEGSN